MSLEDTSREESIGLMRAGRFEEALRLLRAAMSRDPSDAGTLYMAGQCCRFLGDLDGAIVYLARAVEINPKEAPFFLALGIALQLGGHLDRACVELRQAIKVDPDYDLAFNSLGLTQKMQGKHEAAVQTYEAGLNAMSRGIVKSMTNLRSNSILKHRDTSGKLWLEQASLGALYLAATGDGITQMAWPTGKQTEEEERTERHGGLFWIDQVDQSTRLFLPNYFNTFRERLRHKPEYINLLRNRAIALGLLGRNAEAAEHEAEANEFSLD